MNVCWNSQEELPVSNQCLPGLQGVEAREAENKIKTINNFFFFQSETPLEDEGHVQIKLSVWHEEK